MVYFRENLDFFLTNPNKAGQNNACIKGFYASNTLLKGGFVLRLVISFL